MFQEQLQQILNDIIRCGGTEVSASIYYKGKLAAAAVAGGQEVQAEISDRFNVGSVSKVYCAAVVMKLVAEKRITLDTRISEVLPRFHMTDSRYVDITFRMCLNHSSGLPGTGMKLAFQTECLYDEFKDAFFEYLSHGRLKADPGSFSVYCNDGFDLAVFAVEEITGEPYSRYLRREILEPIGAESTGCGVEDLPGKLVREKGGPLEYLACVGSGGIVTNLSDCAKFGSLFTAESSSPITCPQGKSLTGNPQALDYGLGWDTVSLSVGSYDFGPGTLGKSGGTSQFSSYLLVSPKYELSAAISATKDTGIVPLEVILKIAAAFLVREGINVSKEQVPSKAEKQKEYELSTAISATKDTGIVPLEVILKTAATFLEREGINVSKEQVPSKAEKQKEIAGLYFGNRGLYRVSSKERDFSVDAFTPAGWKSFAESGADFSFNERREAVDLMMKWHGTDLVLAQKFEEKESLPARRKTRWEERIGKSYLICNGHPSDLDIGDMVNGITLYQPEGAESEFEKRIILFCAKEAGSFRMMPAIPVNDFETDYVLDGEGSLGCRDTFAPFIESASGLDILYDGGVRYIDTDGVPKLISQTVSSRASQKNPVFRTDADCRITIYKPQHVKVLLFDEALLPYYDERRDRVFPLTQKGYIVFLGREPFSAEVSCEKKETGEKDESRSN